MCGFRGVWLRSYTRPMPRERFQNNAKLVLAVTGGLLIVFFLAVLIGWMS